MTGDVNLTVDSPGDVAAVIAQYGRVDPSGRMIAAAFTPAQQLVFTLSMRMADPPDPAYTCREVTRLTRTLTDDSDWDRVTFVVLVAFGPDHVADPNLDLAQGLIEHMTGRTVKHVLRVHDGRVWSYLDEPCEYSRGSEGEEYDALSDNAIAAAVDLAQAEGLS